MRCVRHLAALGLSCAAFGVGVAVPSADAYLRDFEALNFYPVDQGNIDAFPGLKGSFVYCRGGRTLLGLGGSLRDDFGTPSAVALKAVSIGQAASSRGVVYGSKTKPFRYGLRVWGIAYCAQFTTTRPGTPAPGSLGYVADTAVVSASSPRDPKPMKTVTARCPGRRAIGGGFSVSGSKVTVYRTLLTRSDGSPGLDGNEVVAAQSEGAGWRLTSFVVCARLARLPVGPAYVDRVTTTLGETSAWDSNDKSVSSRCPAGQRIIGGSGEVVDVTSDAPPEVVLSGSHPSGDAWTATAAEVAPTSKSWEVRARAVCAKVHAPGVVAGAGS